MNHPTIDSGSGAEKAPQANLNWRKLRQQLGREITVTLPLGSLVAIGVGALILLLLALD